MTCTSSAIPDGRVEPTLALRRDLARVIRLLRPDRVLCQSPERNYLRMGISHPDHRAVGTAALDAVYPDSRNPFAFPELLAEEKLEPWTVREVWISGSPAPTHYVDVTDAFPRKIAALRAHQSQIADADGPGGEAARDADVDGGARRAARGPAGRVVPGAAVRLKRRQGLVRRGRRPA